VARTLVHPLPREVTVFLAVCSPVIRTFSRASPAGVAKADGILKGGSPVYTFAVVSVVSLWSRIRMVLGGEVADAAGIFPPVRPAEPARGRFVAGVSSGTSGRHLKNRP